MQKEPSFKIYFAPLQESTDHIYRSAHVKFFGGADKYFAPYIVRQNDGTVKNSHLRDIKQANNKEYPLIPQILAGNSADFIFLASLLQENGYNEINWNLGCPYPMVTNKGLGSGLLPFPEQIRTILEASLPKIKSRITVKMRMGLNSAEEIFPVIDVLNDFPLGEVILHPRIARQLYKGTPDEEIFTEVHKRVKLPLVYNGNIETAENYDRLNERFGDTDTWMIGRGILKNPYLPQLLKNGASLQDAEKAKTLRNFHDEILLNYSTLLSGSSHLLMKMEKFWSYFCFSFPDPHKTFKRIKKAANSAKYDLAVNENFQRLKSDDKDIVNG
jgi:tRNA-dihydrouridine synthase